MTNIDVEHLPTCARRDCAKIWTDIVAFVRRHATATNAEERGVVFWSFSKNVMRTNADAPVQIRKATRKSAQKNDDTLCLRWLAKRAESASTTASVTMPVVVADFGLLVNAMQLHPRGQIPTAYGRADVRTTWTEGEPLPASLVDWTLADGTRANIYVPTRWTRRETEFVPSCGKGPHADTSSKYHCALRDAGMVVAAMRRFAPRILLDGEIIVTFDDVGGTQTSIKASLFGEKDNP